MVSDEELEKTMLESQEIIRKGEEYKRQVDMLLQQTNELFEQYQINPDALSAFLKDGDIPPELRKELELEKARLDMELEEEIRSSIEKFKMQKQTNSNPKGTSSRRIRQMV